jgi:kynureninase
MKSRKGDYSRFLAGHGAWLHLCAHSHHFWLDVTREAQLKAWDEAAHLSDRKWDRVLGDLLPKVQRGLADHLGLSRPDRLTFASNTHELYLRLLSCFDAKQPVRVLSSDSEFHSFRRQSLRAQEDGEVLLTIVPQEPRASFAERFAQAAHAADFEVIFVSHVFFNTGGILPGEMELLAALKSRCRMLVLDTYHSFMARPFSLRSLEDDVYVLGGAYKYAQSGEGACFLYTPPKADELRPRNTGWYAHFASLSGQPTPHTEYGAGAWRFWGSTFDPSALYRLEAVLDYFARENLHAAQLHTHSLRLQEQCLALLATVRSLPLLREAATRVLPAKERGNFLSFPLAAGQAKQLEAELAARKILCDSREGGQGSFLRLGWGLYHDDSDISALAQRLDT